MSLHLLRAGSQPLIVTKHTFPRFHIGESLSGELPPRDPRTRLEDKDDITDLFADRLHGKVVENNKSRQAIRRLRIKRRTEQQAELPAEERSGARGGLCRAAGGRDR